MTPKQMHSRIAEVVDSFSDIENASEVVLCLSKALETVIIVASADKDDALNTAGEIIKDMKRDIKKDYARVCIAWERKFENADKGELLQ